MSCVATEGFAEGSLIGSSLWDLVFIREAFLADRKYRERIELLTGTGCVYEGNKEIASVRYRIEVLQTKLENGSSIIDGLKEVQGMVDPISASIYHLFGKTLTLVFEDGRKMDFYVTDARTGSIAARAGIAE
jgi:hypothetical protein